MAKNIAQLMVDTLVQAGVERVYGLPGDSLNGFTDSIRKQKSVTNLIAGVALDRAGGKWRIGRRQDL
jgi:thiamine pyrophosphate-dependent acetolactate synthase large subunit-like protein